ncbi:hypothetical protein BDZ97DRAFT_1757813 [Flammula alnicola]|nr:hypothetical protein BDZ97DRAFT_1757813 [Flammula alnicola]
MPPRKKPKTLRQTTLFDSPSSSSFPPRHSTRSRTHAGPFSSPSKKTEVASDSSSDEIAAIHFEPVDKTATIIISSEDENIAHVPKTSSKRRLIHIRSPSASENETNSPRKEATSPQGHQSNDSEQSDPPRKKTRLRRRKSTEKPSSSDEDMEDLVHEVEEERILNNRLRTRNKSAFQQNLEKLKSKHTCIFFFRKLRLKDEDEEDEDEDEDGKSEEEEEFLTKPFKGSKPSGESDGDSDSEQSASDGSSDFIVFDDGSVELPPQFSMETHQDLSYQFKKIFQFFVHVAVQSAENRAAYMKKQIRDEQYFSVPLQVTRRKLSGLRDSLVSSSVWRPEFKKCLEKYPEFELVRLDLAVPSCDACHLGGRMSTLLGRLSGSSYNAFGFESVSSVDSEEQVGKEFHLGRFCAKRTKVFHEFSHWEYNLFQGILREISDLRETISSSFHRIAYVGGKDPPENLEDADGVCDWLDERKIIDVEWQRMKTLMESARHLEIDKERVDD